jgi:GNAT superfamily N-acetyltransferase
MKDELVEESAIKRLDSASEIIDEYADKILVEMDRASIDYDYSILIGKEQQQEIHIAVVRRPEQELDPHLLEFFDDYVDERDGREYYLVAYNSDKILGIKEFGHIESSVDDSEYRAGGYTAVHEEERGKGVGFALEVAAIDLCQRESDRLGKKITWGISDANAADLAKLTRNSDDIDPDLIERKEVEHARWERLYAGLGFTKVEGGRQRKAFSPGTLDAQIGNNDGKTQTMVLASSGMGADFIVTSANHQEVDPQSIKDELRGLIRAE